MQRRDSLVSIPVVGPTSDEELFDRFRARGDVDALGELFDRLAPPLLRIALHLARDAADAEDLVQATFLGAIEARDRWSEQRAVLPWLCGILQNRARETRRRDARAVDAERVRPTPVADPAGAAEASEFDEAVDAAIAKLPEAYQAVLRLHLAYGHAPAEIAHALSRPPGTVRSQLARGLELLRRALPVGLAGLAASPTSSGRGLAAVREHVLAHAGHAAAIPSSVLPTLAWSWSMVATKQAGVLLGVVLVAAVAWVARRGALPEHARGERVAAPAPMTSGERAPAPEQASGASDRLGVPAGDERAPRSTEDAGSTGSVRVACSWGEDGTPAADITLVAWPVGASELENRAITTDERGEALLAGLPPGAVTIAADRGGVVDVRVAAGSTVGAELVVPPGVDVRGRVVDAEGAPVPAASVWLSSAAHDHVDGRFVATCDASGRFVLRSVEAERFVGATAPGRRSAVPRVVRGDPGTALELDLVLDGAGATLVGTVLDSSGAPVRGARVLVGRREMELRRNPAVHAEHRPPLALETDARGEFRAHGLEPGHPIEAWARALGTCTWYQRVPIESHGDTRLVIHLQRGAMVRGRVTGPDGEPLAAAWVAAGAFAWDGGNWEVGLDSSPSWAASSAATAGDGTYEIAMLPPGALGVRVGTRMHEARAELVLADGEIAQRDFALAECSVRGRLLDVRGAPLAGWSVRGDPARGAAQPVSDRTDSEGRFQWARCADVPYRLDALAPGDVHGLQPFTVHGVRPSGDELVVEIPARAVLESTIEGTLLDAEGLPHEHARIRCVGEGLAYDLHAAADRARGGRFRIDHLPAGTYRLQGTLGAEGRTSWSAPIVLGVHDHLDVGEIRTPRFGALVVHVRDAAGEPIDGADVHAVDEGGALGDSCWDGARTEDGVARLASLAPGEHRIRVSGEDLASQYARAVVVGGEETRAEILVQPGIPCRLAFTPLREPAPMRLTFAWRRNGEPWERYVNLWEVSGALSYSTRLLPGSYEVTITSERGQSSVNRFVLVEPPAPGEERTIELRLP